MSTRGDEVRSLPANARRGSCPSSATVPSGNHDPRCSRPSGASAASQPAYRQAPPWEQDAAAGPGGRCRPPSVGPRQPEAAIPAESTWPAGPEANRSRGRGLLGPGPHCRQRFRRWLGGERRQAKQQLARSRSGSHGGPHLPPPMPGPCPPARPCPLDGPEILRPRERRVPRMANATSPLVEQRVVAFALGHPGFGPARSPPSSPGPSGAASSSPRTGCGGCYAATACHPRQALRAGRRLRSATGS
jgi:hypothetical protein